VEIVLNLRERMAEMQRQMQALVTAVKQELVRRPVAGEEGNSKALVRRSPRL
jgi:hypothetical protein